MNPASLWPSLETWAAAAGIGLRTARRAMRALESKNLIRPVANVKGGLRGDGVGLSTKYQLLPESGLWVPVDSTENRPSQPGRSGRKGGQRRSEGRPDSASNPAAPAAKPSKQQPPEQTSQQPSGAESDSSAGVCLDGRTPSDKDRLLQLLTRAGVKGPKLTELLACDLNAADVEREIADIASDPSILNPAGLLVSRLSPSSKSSRAILKTLPPVDQNVISGIAAIRRQRFRSSQAVSVGSAIQRAAHKCQAANEPSREEHDDRGAARDSDGDG